jgi:PP-loop superfamily ATP-utilizing enzyme
MMENPKSEIRNPNGGSRSTKRFLARIEVGPDEVERLLDQKVRESVTQALKKIGYAHVTLDLQGYRRGSTNEVLVKAKEN